MMPVNENYTFKVVFVGNNNVGKSSIADRFCLGSFDVDQNPTLGASLFVRKVVIKRDSEMYPLNLHIWDTAGQERFFSLVPMYLRDADIIIFVFDASDKGWGLECIKKKWLKIVESRISPPTLFYMVGSKIDLLSEEELDIAKQAYSSYKFPVSSSNVFYVSSRENVGIDELFECIGNDLIDSGMYSSRKNEYISEKIGYKNDKISLTGKNFLSASRCCN